jgi:two-component system, OmpR family, alkaline phosphatase synthesis response regulator PhoP
VPLVPGLTCPDMEAEILEDGEIILNLENCEAQVGRRKVGLTAIEFHLLGSFLENRGQVLTRDVLLNRLWGESYLGSRRTVDTHVQRLRAKLGKASRHIQTVRGLGYRWRTDGR